MIPQFKPRNDFAGSELRERVTACRKRLRNNRFTRAAAGRESAQSFSTANATFLDEDAGMRESLSSIELSSTAQEVGIT